MRRAMIVTIVVVALAGCSSDSKSDPRVIEAVSEARSGCIYATSWPEYVDIDGGLLYWFENGFVTADTHLNRSIAAIDAVVAERDTFAGKQAIRQIHASSVQSALYVIHDLLSEGSFGTAVEYHIELTLLCRDIGELSFDTDRLYP
jgi:hypothetical protein